MSAILSSREMRHTSQRALLAEGNSLVGDAVVYNVWSELLENRFYERIAPGAFDECLARSPDVIACFDHEVRQILGRTSSGTLRLDNNPTRLQATVTSLPDTSYARDLKANIQRGDIKGMSFVFDVVDDDWESRDGYLWRTVKKADLYEVSFVIFPAYPSTSVALRRLQEHVAGETKAHLEFLRLKLQLVERE
jgi:uncharacterized protein